jgi:hypothetical protein
VSAPPAATPDRCAAWVAYQLEDMTWFIGDYGLLDYVDIARTPAVLRDLCKGLSDGEIACDLEDTDRPHDKLGCLSRDKIAAWRDAILPLLKLPAELRAHADAARTCHYYEAMRAMEACGAVPAKMRRKLKRAWASTANVQSPPFACQVGLEVMQQRLAALGC